MSTEARTEPSDAPAAQPGPTPATADPRALGLAAQVLIGGFTVAQLVMGIRKHTGAGITVALVPVETLLFVASVVVFLVWFKRCRINAELLSPGSQRDPEGLAVGAWFIPLAMWWIPRRIARDIWNASGPVTGVWLVEAWWCAWLAKTAAGWYGVATDSGGRSYVEMVAAVVSAAFAIAMVNRLTARQVR